MKRVAARYAIIQFMPYPETGEFANVGVVLACPAHNYFGYKLEARKYARLTHFFRDLDATLFTRSIAAFGGELERVRNMLMHGGGETAVRAAFRALIHPRDAILRFGEERTVLVEKPGVTLDQLFGRYVEHDFVTHEYRETQMERRVQQLVGGLNLIHPFKEARLGGDDYAVRFPLVQMVDEKPAKIIKPFFLGQDDPNNIYNHGDAWIAKLKRLQKRKQLPEKVLFAVEGPTQDDGKRLREKAFLEACAHLKEIVEVVPQVEEEAIRQFAVG